MEKQVTDFVVIGSGIAGLYAAKKLSTQGNVILITKSSLAANNSANAQGGIAVPIQSEDSPEKHIRDTLDCGCGLNDQQAVEMMIRSSTGVFQQLVEMNVPFDRTDEGQYMLGKEGFHTVSRIVHASGDATGKMMVNTLIEHIRSHPRITFYEHTYVEDILVNHSRCDGALIVRDGSHIQLMAKAVILACGGAGQVYDRTTNVLGSTGDGFGLAYRAGAKLMDMEFVQFHPTALNGSDNPRPLISEAVRGEGAVLVNDRGVAFMQKYHPWADLAPRDVVSRAIYQEMSAGRTVFLDPSHIGTNFPARFPSIYKRCLQNHIDPIHDWIPVSPVAHFIMGGVATDHWGRTTIKGLYACGEVACSGVHGANRLASNSLLEGLVFADRIAAAVAVDSLSVVSVSQSALRVQPRFAVERYRYSPEELMGHPELQSLQTKMWENVGIVRDRKNMQKMIQYITDWQKQWSNWHPVWENMAITAQLIVRSSLHRQESRGAHYREDFPQTSKLWEKKRSICTYRIEESQRWPGSPSLPLEESI